MPRFPGGNTNLHLKAGLSHLALMTMLPCHATASVPVILAERAGLRPASESRNPVIKAVRGFTPAVDYWVPARASPVEPGSLGRDDSPYAIALLSGGGIAGLSAPLGSTCDNPGRPLGGWWSRWHWQDCARF